MKKKVLISLLAFAVMIAGCNAVKENENETVAETTKAESVVETKATEESEAEPEVDETEADETEVDETEATEATETEAGDDQDDALRFYEILEPLIDDGVEVEITIDDFDLDGTNEAFAFLGSSYDDGDGFGTLYSGAFYYVTDDGYELIKESYPVDFGDCGEVLDFGARKYFRINNIYATAGVTELYSVKDGSYYEELCSGVGYVYNIVGNDCTITLSAYDTTYDSSIDAYIGHSWKPYYFCYDAGVDAIVEYVGEEISMEEAATYLPDGVLDEVMAEGYVVDNAFIRGNGILNVNYHFEESDGSIQYKNLNYDTNAGVYEDAWATGANDWNGSNYGGTYYASVRGE